MSLDSLVMKRENKVNSSKKSRKDNIKLRVFLVANSAGQDMDIL